MKLLVYLQLNLNISRGGKQQKSAKKHVTEEDKGKSKIESQEPENVQAETDVSPAVFQKTVTTAQKSVKKDAINEDKEKLKFDYNDHDGLQFDNDFSAVLFQQPSTLSNKETGKCASQYFKKFRIRKCVNVIINNTNLGNNLNKDRFKLIQLANIYL